MKANGVPDKVAMDKSGANKAAMNEINARGEKQIVIRQVKYLNNLVEQDHRAIKCVTRPMLNFKSFRTARSILVGIELMHMIRKGQLMMEDCIKLSFADQFVDFHPKLTPRGSILSEIQHSAALSLTPQPVSDGLHSRPNRWPPTSTAHAWCCRTERSHALQ